ncbi:MAG: hypothetical protein M0Z45_07395 [Actinomycetota bacterium]|nr:hypothetical protein [Actinomycetota bacterium]
MEKQYLAHSIEPYELVRTSCLQRAKSLSHLSIDELAIGKFAYKIAAGDRGVIGTVDSNFFLDFDDITTGIYYVLIADTINFGSGWFPYLKKIDGGSGAVSIATALSNYCRQYAIPTPNQLCSLTTDTVAQMLGQENSDEAGQLMELYRIALFQLGQLLIEDYQGDAMNLVEEAGESAGKLVTILASLPFYKDFVIEGSEITYFYKRAQIAASDIALVTAGQSKQFKDIDRLTIFADNVLPNLLRVEGVLKFSEELTQKIASEQLFEVGSSDEVELRAATVVACESIVNHLNLDHQITISPRELDQLLWSMGRQKIYKESPRHRCRCTFY